MGNDPDMAEAVKWYNLATVIAGVSELSYQGITKFNLTGSINKIKGVYQDVASISKANAIKLIQSTEKVYQKIAAGTLQLGQKGKEALGKLKDY